ncbi:MAG: zinc ribbon domain-containing protein, partial [Thermodesulfobacteriota bacterium]
MRCGRCATELIPGKRFCHACGAPAASACPGCGALTDASYRFCPDCGHALAEPAGGDADAPAAGRAES